MKQGVVYSWDAVTERWSETEHTYKSVYLNVQLADKLKLKFQHRKTFSQGVIFIWKNDADIFFATYEMEVT